MYGNDGYFTLGPSHHNYGNNEICEGMIITDHGMRIRLFFTTFDVQNGRDFVNVYDGRDANADQIAHLTGSEIPGDVTSSGRYMFVQFVSDAQGTGTGFSASYSAESVPSSETPTHRVTTGSTESPPTTADTTGSTESPPTPADTTGSTESPPTTTETPTRTTVGSDSTTDASTTQLSGGGSTSASSGSGSDGSSSIVISVLAVALVCLIAALVWKKKRQGRTQGEPSAGVLPGAHMLQDRASQQPISLRPMSSSSTNPFTNTNPFASTNPFTNANTTSDSAFDDIDL